MHSFDFLSNSPKNFIFHKNSNKTNLGGVLFIIYIIIILGISFAYLYDFFSDYISNNKYVVQSSLIEEFVDDERAEELKAESETNPVLNFSIELYDYHGEILSNNFIIKDWRTGEEIKRNSIFKKKVSDLIIDLLYNCSDPNCDLKEEDKTYFNYWIEINYTGFNLDHQTDGIPLKKESGIFCSDFPFFYKNALVRYLYWDLIKYNDESKGFSRLFYKVRKINKTYIAGSIVNTEYYILDESFYGYDSTQQIDTKFLGRIVLMNYQDKITEYKRTKKSFMDILATIFALLSSFYTGFSFSFGFLYSGNFDNYKIVEKILTEQKGKKYNNSTNIDLNNIKEIELSNIFRNSSLASITSNANNFIYNDDINIDNNNEYDNNNYINYKNNNNEESNINIPKLRFWDFLLNSFYKKSFMKSEKQEFLYICNEILYKYISIDYILYNQIKLENLLKDYKWNNPKLNNIENNELIIELKKHI